MRAATRRAVLAHKMNQPIQRHLLARLRPAPRLGQNHIREATPPQVHTHTLYPLLAPPASPPPARRRSGGVQGGISNGEDIVLRVAFKPTATIARKQATVSRAGEDVELLARGRHDPCVVGGLGGRRLPRWPLVLLAFRPLRGASLAAGSCVLWLSMQLSI